MEKERKKDFRKKISKNVNERKKINWRRNKMKGEINK